MQFRRAHSGQNTSRCTLAITATTAAKVTKEATKSAAKPKQEDMHEVLSSRRYTNPHKTPAISPPVWAKLSSRGVRPRAKLNTVTMSRERNGLHLRLCRSQSAQLPPRRANTAPDAPTIMELGRKRIEKRVPIMPPKKYSGPIFRHPNSRSRGTPC